jgi:Transposase DDE domain group 1
MEKDTLSCLRSSSGGAKGASVVFNGGLPSSDAGALVLRDVERNLGLATRQSGCLRDRRTAGRIDHDLEEMLRLRMFAISAGYEDPNDCD